VAPASNSLKIDIGKTMKPLIQNKDHEIQRKTELLALLRLEHGPTHLDTITAILDLAQTYILNNSVEPAMYHIENALKSNAALANIIQQRRTREMCDVEFSFDLDDVRSQCEATKDIILLTIALIHLKIGNLSTSETLITKIKEERMQIIESTKAGLEYLEEDRDNVSDVSTLSEFGEHNMGLQLLEAIVLLESCRYNGAESILQDLLRHQGIRDEEPTLLPVYLLMGNLYSSQNYNSHTKKSIEYYLKALRLVERHHHGYGMDRVMIMIQLLQLYWSLAEHQTALELASEIEHVIMEIAYHHITLLTQRSNMYIGQIVHYLKWTCWVKVFISSKYMECEQYQDAAMTLLSVIQFNETALNQAQGRTSTPQKQEFRNLILDLVETAKLYQKLGQVYASVGQNEDAVDMYKRGLCALYQHREQRNGKVSQRANERDALIGNLLNEVAKIVKK